MGNQNEWCEGGYYAEMGAWLIQSARRHAGVGKWAAFSPRSSGQGKGSQLNLAECRLDSDLEQALAVCIRCMIIPVSLAHAWN